MIPAAPRLSAPPAPLGAHGTLLDRRHSAIGASELLELLESGRPEWHKDALCKEYSLELFFPPQGVRPGEAKAVCARCAVWVECQTYALESAAESADLVVDGVWGGTTVALPRIALDALESHVSTFTEPGADATVVTCLRGGFRSPGRCSKAWRQAVAAVGAPKACGSMTYATTPPPPWLRCPGSPRES